MKHALSTACAALALTLLLGQVTDRTTGQPLRGVHVDVTTGGTTLHATTDAHGRFQIDGVKPGNVTIGYSSADVPPDHFTFKVEGTRQQVRITACSTTLDYSCSGPGGGG